MLVSFLVKLSRYVEECRKPCTNKKKSLYACIMCAHPQPPCLAVKQHGVT